MLNTHSNRISYILLASGQTFETMSRNLSNSGPHFPADGRSYYVVNGQKVWGSSGQKNPGYIASSTRGIAYSVDSKFESGRFPTTTSRSGSYPPVIPPSGLKTRMTTGCPESRYNSGQSQGSAPATGHQTFDPYLQSVDPKHSTARPRGFFDSYNEFKDLDVGGAEIQYQDLLQTANKVTTKMRQENPGLCAGQPLEKKEWH